MRFDETDPEQWWYAVARPLGDALSALRAGREEGAERVLLEAADPAAAPDVAQACLAAAVHRLAESLDGVDGILVAAVPPDAIEPAVAADPAELRSRALRIDGGPW